MPPASIDAEALQVRERTFSGPDLLSGLFALKP